MHIVTRRALLVGAGAAAGTVAAALIARKPGAVAAEEESPALPDLSGLKATGPTPLPDIGFTDAAGARRTPADYAGRPALLNLWATWCVPCVAEMPALDAFAARAPEFTVLPLSSDRAGAPAVERFFRERGVAHLPVLLDPRGEAARALGARGIPTTLVLDAQGRERGRLEGAAAWASDAAVARLRALVA